MTPSPASIPPDLAEASDALRQVLLRLDHYARQQVQRLDPTTRYAAATMAHVGDLQALLTAVEQYEQAALAHLAAPPATVGQLCAAPLAQRKADPVYQLGYTQGYQDGATQAQQSTAPVLSAYARYATLPAPTTPPPTDYAALVQRVRKHLAELTARYGAGPISRFYPTPHGTH